MIITILSLVSFKKDTIISIQNSDKLVHFLLYFILTILLLRSSKQKFKFKYLIIIALPFFYGIIIEVLQESFTTDRKGDFYDVLANLTGIICAAMLNKYVLVKFSSSKI